MDIKLIKELITAMEKADLKKLRIKEEKGYELELERFGDGSQHPQPIVQATPHFTPPPVSAPPHAMHRPHAEEHKPGTFITSPMVGTFYAAHSPDDPPCVKVGDQVDENTPVCIIEAMKVMNEVKAGKKGRVAEVLVANAEPVEFGTKLFRIE